MIKRILFEGITFSAVVLIVSSGTLGLYFFGMTSWLVGIPFLSGCLILLITLALNLSLLKQHLRSQATFYWGVTFAKGTMIFALLGALNWWAVQKRLVWDFTSSQVFSLSEQSVAVIEAVSKPHILHVFYGPSEPERAVMKELVLRYQQHSEFLEVRFYDPSADFEKTQKYKIQVEGTRVVLETLHHKIRIEERFRIDLSQGDHEQKMTNALMRLRRDRSKKVYILVGHQEASHQNDDREGIALLYEALLTEGYDVLPLRLNQEEIDTTNTAAVLILGPKDRFLPDEIKNLSAYLSAGGRLGLAMEPGRSAGLGGFLGRYGIQINRDMVVDRSGFSQMYQEGPTTVVASNYPSAHPMTRSLKGDATVFPGASSISINPGGEGETSVLVQSGPNAWGETSLLEEVPDTQLKWNPGEVRGRATLLVANEHEASRLWVSSDVDFLTNAYFNLSSNRNLALNAVGWLVNSQSHMTIRPHVRGHHRVLLSQKQKEWMAFLLVYLWPLLSLFFGIWVSRYRTLRAGVSI